MLNIKKKLLSILKAWGDGDTHIMQRIRRCIDTISQQAGDPCKYEQAY